MKLCDRQLQHLHSQNRKLQKSSKSWRYPAKTITNADYADDMAILANTLNQAETLLHSVEQAATGIGLHVNAHKTEYMCFNQTGDICTRDGSSLKLVDKFTYLGGCRKKFDIILNINNFGYSCWNNFKFSQNIDTRFYI